MARPRRLLIGGAVLALAGYAAWVATRRPLAVPGPAPGDGATHLRGAVHVHTDASDGSGTAEQVIAAARAAGLDFLAITDHNHLEAKPLEGRHGELLVIVGTEISTTAGHVVALGLPDPQLRFSGDVRDVLDDVRALGGVAFAAHPTSPKPELTWTGWELPGSWGLEVLNGDTQWREAGWWRLARMSALYALNPRHALLTTLSPPDAALERWDALLAERDAAAITGADAHARLPLAKGTWLRFPSYESLFGLARNHVRLEGPLAADDGEAVRQVIDALARGRSWVAVDALAPGDGFRFAIERGGERWGMGETVAPQPGLRARAGGALPEGALLRLLRDGEPHAESPGALDAPAAAPGVYRVEVRVPGWDLPWVISNPVYVFDEAAAERRRARARWPAPPAVPAETALIDGFEGETRFAAEFDASSSMERPVIAPGAGHDGGGAARLAFRLGAPGPDRPYTWCALVERAERDLSGFEGLVFRIRGDGVYRIWVQVRDENPASADEGQEWWFASARTSPEWRQVALPFARFRSINPASDGRLDLDAVRGLVFVLDGGAVEPGTEGVIWIDDLRAF